MTKRKKIILISMAVTLALVLSVGGLAPVLAKQLHPTSGERLLGVGWCASYYYEQPESWKDTQALDTMFIITNPNCDQTMHLDWLFIIDEDEKLVCEDEIDKELSPHEVWEFYLSEKITVEEKEGRWQPPQPVLKYTVEIIWSGVSDSRWGFWRGSPCAGWMKQLIITETWEWVEDACQCVDAEGQKCEWDKGAGQCTGACGPEAIIPGADCSECGCECLEIGTKKCGCQPESCGAWVYTMPVTEVSESQMVNCELVWLRLSR